MDFLAAGDFWQHIQGDPRLNIFSRNLPSPDLVQVRFCDIALKRRKAVFIKTIDYLELLILLIAANRFLESGAAFDLSR